MKVLISDKAYLPALKDFDEAQIQYVYDPEISASDLLSSIVNYDALMVRSRTKVTKEVIEKGKNLKVIGRMGSGVDNIDVTSAKGKNIIVVNAPNANSQAVAEHTIGLALSLLRNFERAFLTTRKGQWLKKKLGGQEINGKTFGIVGFGHAGKIVEKLAKAFGAKTLIFSRRFKNVSLSEIFSQSDIISLHLPLVKETKGFLGKPLLSLMKNEAVLINTSRAGLVDEEALYQVLSTGMIAGAALDVFWEEPLLSQSKWTKLENVVLTPHIAGSTNEALVKGTEAVVLDIINILNGKMAKNLVI